MERHARRHPARDIQKGGSPSPATAKSSAARLKLERETGSNPSRPNSRLAVCIREARTDAHEQAYKCTPVGVSVGVSRSTSLCGYKKAPQPAKPPLSAPGKWPCSTKIPSFRRS